jgi:exopolysaccharide biosynthesis polyprenyl glycosylphosphotransferase
LGSGSTAESGEPEEAIRVWPYWTPRPTAPRIAVAVFLTINIVAAAAWAGPAVQAGDPAVETLLLSLSLFGYLALCYAVGLNRQLVGTNTNLFSLRTLGSVGSFFALLALIPYFFPRISFSSNVRDAVVLSLLLLFAVRFVLSRLRRHQEILIVGTAQHAQKLYLELIDKTCWPVSSPLVDNPRPVVAPGSAIDCRKLRELAVENGIATIVIAEPDLQNRVGVAEALLDCKARGVKVESAIDCYEKCIRKVWLAGIHPAWLIYTARFRPSRLYLVLKRILDVCLAAALGVFALPILAVSAIAIKLDSPGPILFRQSRVGVHGAIFNAWKFRTMCCNAESSTGPVWAQAEDKRITLVGRILRRYRIDEIPQVLNVLHGEMSIIGPRPERPNFVELLKEKINYYALRLCVKPGITGWAQVMQPYGASIDDAYLKLEYDLYYLKHMTLATDFLILFKTVPVVLGGHGR